MCEIINCNPRSEERRSFLVGTGALLLAIAASAPVIANQTQTAPTRVLDNKAIQHGRVNFKSGAKEIDGYLARPKTNGKYHFSTRHCGQSHH